MKLTHSSHNSPIFSNNSLFSSIITLYILIFLYFPCNSLKLIVCPILISTLILLLSLLRLGASQQTSEQLLLLRQQQQQRQVNDYHVKPKPEPSLESDLSQEHEHEPSVENDLSQEEAKEEVASETRLSTEPGLAFETLKPTLETDLDAKNAESFVGWGLWGPLEVIYEGEEGEEENGNNKYYQSLSRYYPDSDTDTDTGSSSSSLDDEDFSEIRRWEEEEKEGMFEISFDYGNSDYNNSVIALKKSKKDVEVDEDDNLIEIDISH